MKYASLGATGIHVSRICMGTMTFGSPLAQSDCDRLVSAALDQGINFFDTADVYEGYTRTWGSGGGVSETMLGNALAGQRHRAAICTKFGNPAGAGPLDAGLSAHHLEKQMEASLRRLQTDHVDVFLAHRWDGAIAMDELLRTFDRWIQSGRVRCVGSSNFPVWRIAQACEMSVASGRPKLQVLSPKYNLMRRGVELEQAACARHYGASLVSYQPLEAGVLSGKYRRDEPAPAGSRGSDMPGWIPKLDEATHDRLDGLRVLAAECSASPAEYAMAWVLSRPQVAATILGWRSEEQMNSAVRAVDLQIPAGHLSRIDALFPPPAPVGDERILQWRENGWKLENTEP